MSDLQKNTESAARSSPLGERSLYIEHYAPDLLFPIARSEKRAEIGLCEGDVLPFFGADLWNAYELSWLNLRGKPQVALAEFQVPAHSTYLIESKSLKLYLNSFNQTRIASFDHLENTLRVDLSAAANATVSVRLMPLSEHSERRFMAPQAILLDTQDIDVDVYHLQPAFLRTLSGEVVEETLFSYLLKSNCLVTGQPDWGSVHVRYRGAPIDRVGLLRYIVSFRQHNEFHEQCVERIFMDVARCCQPEQLAVWARYTRRGGLDINPYRSSKPLPPLDNQFDIRQ